MNQIEIENVTHCCIEMVDPRAIHKALASFAGSNLPKEDDFVREWNEEWHEKLLCTHPDNHWKVMISRDVYYDLTERCFSPDVTVHYQNMAPDKLIQLCNRALFEAVMVTER